MLVVTKIAKNLFIKINLLAYEICNCDQCNECSECFPQKAKVLESRKSGEEIGEATLMSGLLLRMQGAG